MPCEERIKIVEAIKYVDKVIKSVDTDSSVCETIKKIKKENSADLFYFCNGGDRTSGENTPEHPLCLELGIEPVYGLGDKIQSSSWLTK